MGYTKSAIAGVTWMSAFRIFSRLISFLKLAVIARILSPSDFGIFGIATLILALFEILTEAGINVFLIQIKEDIKKYIDSAWVLSIVRGILLFVIILLASPFIASFFDTPQSLGILIFIAFVPLIRGFINPAEIIFQKDLKFKYEFLFRSSIFFIDALAAIILIIITKSVYSLVFGLLVGALFEVAISFIAIKPIPKFKIHKSYFGEIFHRGKWVTAYGVLNYFGENGDNIVVGKFLGTSSLGLYQMAYKISILPISEVSDVINRVVFPVYSRIGDDINRLRKAFLKTTSLILFFSFFIGIIIFLFPKEIILIILGSKWISAAPVLQVLSLYGVLRAVNVALTSLFLAVNKQEYVTVMTFLRGVVLLLTIYPLVLTYGIIGAGYSALLSVLVEIPVSIYFSYKILKQTNSIKIDEKNL